MIDEILEGLNVASLQMLHRRDVDYLMFVDLKIYNPVSKSPYHFDFNGKIRLNIKSESSIEHFDPEHQIILCWCFA